MMFNEDINQINQLIRKLNNLQKLVIIDSDFNSEQETRLYYE